MVIHTPQGLRIKLDVATSFGLMARLYPDIRPKQVLKTTEDISLISSALGFVTGLLCFVLQLEPQSIGICTFTAVLVGIFINASGLLLFPFVQLGAAFNRIYVFFLPTILMIVVGYFLTDWQGVIAYLLTRCTAFGLSILVGMGLTRHAMAKWGHAFTTSERHFFHAYRYYAERIGVPTNLVLSYEELDESFWQHAYCDFLQSHPEVNGRFSA